MSDSAPPVSETAAWTEQVERALAIYGDLSDAVGSEPRTVAIRFAREIRRLRAENERLTKLVQRVVDEHEIHDNDPLLNALLAALPALPRDDPRDDTKD